ncbi:ATP-binding protein [Streptomyces sp. C1-2]|uniref:ATP-binding protein n=1 Tax=Streptomyces sp. C1-2 TaxID=2720022 RepID=UPI003211D173
MTGLLDTEVPATHAHHLLAVLREALSNAARHAGATTLEVSVEASERALRPTVGDNGRGIDPAVARRSGLADSAQPGRGARRRVPHRRRRSDRHVAGVEGASGHHGCGHRGRGPLRPFRILSATSGSPGVPWWRG